MVEGIIIKGIAGFYYVQAGDTVYECKARGKFKNKNETPLVGDCVTISMDGEGKGVIETIEPRRNELFRPAVANVDQSLIVFALKNPDPHLNLLDKLLILGEYVGIKAIICLNKADIDDINMFEHIRDIYEPIGYKVVVTSVVDQSGFDVLMDELHGRITVLAGPSGVGKSSILNTIQPGLAAKVGEISEKIKRGKHTTRHSELIALESGGYVVDTPGFSSIDIEFVGKEHLATCFPEIREMANACQFNNCMHIKEPNCAVKEAVERGEIHEERYNSYLYFMNLLEDSRRKKQW
ncbi:MAG: ribosome small subunit-dependent GTPase A [Clostridia bacterium]|nr:ribosome small subunit-dependent GTPase A [Clostridia bacterium]